VATGYRVAPWEQPARPPDIDQPRIGCSRHPSNRRNRMAMRKSACGRECFRRIPLIDRLKGKPCFAGLSQLGEPGWASPVHRENGFVGRYRADQRGRTAWLPGKRSCGRGAFKTFAYKRSGAGVEHAGRHGHNGLPVSRPDCLGGGRGRRRCQRARSSGRCGTGVIGRSGVDACFAYPGGWALYLYGRCRSARVRGCCAAGGGAGAGSAGAHSSPSIGDRGWSRHRLRDRRRFRALG
jgi:hypothetical protein